VVRITLKLMFGQAGFRRCMVSIGFFIWISLLVNGTLILVVGIYQLVDPPGKALFY
jgi:hypothetical protein